VMRERNKGDRDRKEIAIARFFRNLTKSCNGPATRATIPYSCLKKISVQKGRAF